MGHLLQNFEFLALFVKTNSKLNSEGAYNYFDLCSKVFIKPNMKAAGFSNVLWPKGF